jgi:hypothetical protein
MTIMERMRRKGAQRRKTNAGQVETVEARI